MHKSFFHLVELYITYMYDIFTYISSDFTDLQ